MEPVPQAGATGAVNEPVYNTPATETGAAPVQTPAPVQPVQVAAPPPKAKFFDGITLPDVIVGTMLIAGLGLAIYYFRTRIKHAGREYPELRTDVDNLKQQLEDMKSPEMKTEFGSAF